MADNFHTHPSRLESPGSRHLAVTPDNDEDLPFVPRALYVDASGTVAIRDYTGQDITYNVTVGQVLPFRPVRVLSTGTTATVVAWE